MRRTPVWRTLVAMSLLVGLPAASIPAPAATAAALTGIVVAGAGDPAPLAGAVVHLADAETGVLVASAPTDASGAFRAGSIAPATYRVGVESEGRLYAVASPLTLAPGQSQNVTVAVPGSARDAATPEEDENNEKGGLTWWNNPLTASLLIVGGAVILGIAIDKATDDDKPTSVSPFTLQE